MKFHAPSFNSHASAESFSFPQFSAYSQPTAYRGASSESYVHASEVVILEPQSFSEIPSVVQILRNNQVVVLNLVKMNSEEAQRSVDFIAGGAYMCQGYLEKIDVNIFLCTPYHTNIRVESRSGQDTPESSSEFASQSHQPHFSEKSPHYPLAHQAS